MATIGIVDENGEVQQKKTISKGSSVSAGDGEDATEITPSVTQKVKFDNKGQMSSITTECGETENRRTGDNKPNITVEGVIVEDEIADMRSLKNQETVTFVSDIYDGEVIVERLSITQDSDLLYYIPDGSDERQLAFSFQLQLKQPE